MFDDDEDGDGGGMIVMMMIGMDITVVMSWTFFMSKTMYFCRYTNILTYVCGVCFQKAFGD